MTDQEEYTRLIESTALKLARSQNLPLDSARLQARSVLGGAWQRYQRAGTPYGDTMTGFLTWWFEEF